MATSRIAFVDNNFIYLTESFSDIIDTSFTSNDLSIIRTLTTVKDLQMFKEVVEKILRCKGYIADEVTLFKLSKKAIMHLNYECYNKHFACDYLYIYNNYHKPLVITDCNYCTFRLDKGDISIIHENALHSIFQNSCKPVVTYQLFV